MTEQSSASTATAADLSTPTGHQAELARLRRLVELSVAYVIVIATGAIVGILVLFDEARTASLRNLALISLLGGVLGSAGRNLLDLTPDRYFGVHVIPLYLLYPLIGAVLGRLSLRFLLRDLSPPPRGRSGRPLRRRDRHEQTGRPTR